jgi:GNAT superfamily N-acetyltransferase
VEIRDVLPEEYEAAGDVVWRAYSEFADPDDPGWIEYRELLEDVAGRVDRTVVLVAVDDGRVLGSATIELEDVVGDDDQELPPDVAVLRMLGVLPDARGRGVGRALVEATIERARAASKRELRLRTTAAMTAAHRLYESMGFIRDVSLDVQVSDDFTLLGYRLYL